MKILMTVIMTLAVTSTFAADPACALNGACKSLADCKSLNAGYALEGGKCINPSSNETSSECKDIVGTQKAKSTDKDAPVDAANSQNAKR